MSALFHGPARNFQPMGDPGKAAKVMVDLVENPEPPIHLVLGSEAAAILEKANAAPTAEFEKWLPMTPSTDHDEAGSFLESAAGKVFPEHQK